MAYKLDYKTQKALSENEELALFVKGNAWGIIRKMIMKHMVDLADITSLDVTREDVSAQIMGRKLAIEAFRSLLVEIEGGGMLNKTTEELVKDFIEDSVVSYHDNLRN